MLKQLKNKNTAIVAILLLILVSILAGLRGTQQQIDLRSSAAGDINVSLVTSSVTIQAGDTVNYDVVAQVPQNLQLSGIEFNVSSADAGILRIDSASSTGNLPNDFVPCGVNNGVASCTLGVAPDNPVSGQVVIARITTTAIADGFTTLNFSNSEIFDTAHDESNGTFLTKNVTVGGTGETVDVSFSAATGALSIGGTTTIDMNIDTALHTTAMEVSFQYDPSILDCTIEEGDILPVRLQLPTCSAGECTMTLGVQPSQEGPQGFIGQGTVGTATCTAIAAGTSLLQCGSQTNFTSTETDGINVGQCSTGQLTVVDQPTSAPPINTPTPVIDECFDDSHCAIGELCVNNSCVAQPTSGPTTSVDRCVTNITGPNQIIDDVTDLLDYNDFVALYILPTYQPTIDFNDDDENQIDDYNTLIIHMFANDSQCVDGFLPNESVPTTVPPTDTPGCTQDSDCGTDGFCDVEFGVCAIPEPTTEPTSPPQPTTPPPGDISLEPFGTVSLSPEHVINTSTTDSDTIAFFEAASSTNSLGFTTGKGNDIVSVWNPNTGQEIDIIDHSCFNGGGSVRVNGVWADNVNDILHVAVSKDTNTVCTFNMPSLTFAGSYINGANNLQSEPNLWGMILPNGTVETYITGDANVYHYNATTGQQLNHFTVPHDTETIMIDEFYNVLYIPDEGTKTGATIHDFSGNVIGSFGGGGIFQADEEGIAIYECRTNGADNGEGLIVIADQISGSTDFEFFNRKNKAYLGTLEISGVGNTDGIAITQQPYTGNPLGIFAAIDNDSTTNLLGIDEIFAATGLSCGS